MLPALLLPVLLPLARAADRAAETDATCDRVEAKPLAVPPPLSPEALAALPACDLEALYYGMGRPADPAAARHCAWSTISTGSDEYFGPKVILMMIYANGRGVARDLDLATRFACEVHWATAERELRVAHLQQLKAELAAGTEPAPFDWCDDITSGYMQGVCAEHTSRQAELERQARRAAVEARLTPPQRAALAKLDAAAEAFFQQRVDLEVDQSGTGRHAFMTQESDALAESLLGALEQAGTEGFPPAATEADLQAADAALNAAYQRIRKDPAFRWGTVDRDGVQQAQRRWIPYRDAWVTFGEAMAPGSGVRWATWATRARTAQLQELLD